MLLRKAVSLRNSGVGNLLANVSRKERAAIARDQLAAYYQNVPAGSVANVFNAIFLAVAFWSSVSHALLFGWIASITLAAAFHMALRQAGLRQGEDVDADHELSRNVPGSLLIGALWAMATAYFATRASPTQMVILGIVAAGMLNGGLHSLRSVPNIAIAFLAPLAIGNVFFFVIFGMKSSLVAGAIMTMLSLSYAAMLYHALRTSFEAFVGQSLGRIQAKESAETVSLLLKDYEDQGADWLWEVDKTGRLGIAGHAFATAAERPAELLSHSKLVDLFEDSPERHALQRHVSQSTGFRDLTVPLLVHGEQRWWTLSARPQADGKTVVGLRGGRHRRDPFAPGRGEDRLYGALRQRNRPAEPVSVQRDLLAPAEGAGAR